MRDQKNNFTSPFRSGSISPFTIHHSPFRTGFTLIEILIALTIMVVGLIGLLALFPVAILSSTQSSQDSHASIMAKSVKNALTDAVHNASIVDNGGVPYFEIPFRHSGVPLQGDGPGSYDPTVSNIGRNFNGTYFIGLPVTPPVLTANDLDPPYFFPSRYPFRDSDGTVNPSPPGDGIDIVDADASSPLGVFYMGKWIGGEQEYKTPDVILDLETGGVNPEDETDTFAQYCYRLEARPAPDLSTTVDETDVIDGLWAFTVFVYRQYDLSMGQGANWYKPETGVDKNKVIHKFEFQLAIR